MQCCCFKAIRIFWQRKVSCCRRAAAAHPPQPGCDLSCNLSASSMSALAAPACFPAPSLWCPAAQFGHLRKSDLLSLALENWGSGCCPSSLSLEVVIASWLVFCCQASCVQAHAHDIVHILVRVTLMFYVMIDPMQVEGVKALTSTYKQIQDSFAEQIVIYLQTAWRRYAARKQGKIVDEQHRTARTSTFDRESRTSSTEIYDVDYPDS